MTSASILDRIIFGHARDAADRRRFRSFPMAESNIEFDPESGPSVDATQSHWSFSFRQHLASLGVFYGADRKKASKNQQEASCSELIARKSENKIHSGPRSISEIRNMAEG